MLVSIRQGTMPVGCVAVLCAHTGENVERVSRSIGPAPFLFVQKNFRNRKLVKVWLVALADEHGKSHQQ
jgi:hypothetical protein